VPVGAGVAAGVLMRFSSTGGFVGELDKFE
jgi:hypothetical protein